MDDDELFDRLERQGTATPPPPSPALAARLTGEHLTRPLALRPRPVITFGVALPSAAVAALVLGFVLIAFGRSTPAETVLVQQAANATVEGDTVRPGARLADGQVILTGDDGYFVAGAITIGPNSRAIVRDGNVVLLRGVATATPSTATTTTSTTATAAVPPSVPTATSTPATTAPPRVATTTTTAPPARPVPPAGIQLRGTRSPRGPVFASWTVYDGPGFDAYALRRVADGSTAFRTIERATLQGVDRTAPPAPARYVLVVLDAQQRVIATSNVVEL